MVADRESDGLKATVLTVSDGVVAGTRDDRSGEALADYLVAEGFGPGINGPLIVAIDLNGDASVVELLGDAVLADPGIASIAPANVNTEAGVATIIAFPTTAPQDDETIETVTRLRAEVCSRQSTGPIERSRSLLIRSR